MHSTPLAGCMNCKAPLQHRSRQQRAGQQQNKHPCAYMKRQPSWGVRLALSSACAFWMTCSAKEWSGRRTESCHHAMPRCTKSSESCEWQLALLPSRQAPASGCSQPRFTSLSQPTSMWEPRSRRSRTASAYRSGNGQELMRRQTMMSEPSASPHHNCLPARRWGPHSTRAS